MKYAEARLGRTFIIRLEDGEILHETIEAFARAHAITAAAIIALGGADEGSRLVVGPEHGRSKPVSPMEHILADVHEIAGVGTIFPDKDRNPVLHMHIASGRNESTITGCVRRGVRVWQVLEVILFELHDTRACRIFDTQTGFELLEP
ncbi:MAG: DNA-binding protein [Methanophagales archaeon ANME-1-THS]|nr:MAG: DNA-binding protein [Methanophagales archaeon ANME-1-THS]